jgi:hypothetical protein
MTDNDLINLLATQMEAAVANAGWNLLVIQKGEPTQQGQPSDGAVYFEKLFDHPYGFPGFNLTLNSNQTDFSETESQWYETRFQISALVTQAPDNLSLPTASDVANYVKMFMASRPTRAALMAQNVGMLRVLEVRNPWFEDDRSRMEASPNFDLVLVHQRDLVVIVPGTNIIVGTVIPEVPQQAGVFPVLP